ncbi:alpha-2-HS-glycoprotein 2 [Trichomycterus rosablanca]|uniref:alpha-2-HS-glycoprotein 2 n=1 Tax=Trichomycterus rosablanca TaxID=2290929 RepID=UPI002F35FB37
MKLRAVVVILGFLAGASCARLKPNVTLLPCESPEAQAASQLALDFINGQNTHGYKYALNQIEEFQLITKPDGTEVYLLELEFYETKCHVLDPTPLPQCKVRPKIETAIEADCDVALTKAGDLFLVAAFKCKTETEKDRCVGCPRLRPLNDTNGAHLVQASLDHFNKNHSLNAAFVLLEVGRVSSQVVSGGAKYKAEYAIIETNCTSSANDICAPLNHTVARHGFCHTEGSGAYMKVGCDIFVPPPPPVDPVTNATLPAPPTVLLHAHTGGPGFTPEIHSLTHHKLTAFHDPNAISVLSESDSFEAASIVKREVVADAPPAVSQTAGKQLLVAICPAKKIHF